MRIKIKLIVVLCVINCVASFIAVADVVNPYNYDVYSDAINDAKWQVGYNSEKQCYADECEDVLDSSSMQDLLWADSSNKQMHFSTDGSKDEKWRNELRFNAEFSRGSSRTFTARVGYWKGQSTSAGFTMAQLHMASDDDYDVKGPPARLEVIDENAFVVKWRNAYDCSSDCWSSNEFSTSTSGWKDIQLQTSGDYINVSVAGQTFSMNMKGSDTNWPSKGGYYWKTGIYLQDEGTAYTGYKSIYW